MSRYIRRATITIDSLANLLFLQDREKARGYLDILENLQRNLQDKGDDPRYARVVFAADGEKQYVQFLDTDIRLEGVFPRVSAVRYDYCPSDELIIRNNFDTIVRDTLVVANNQKIADFWTNELSSLRYQIRKI